MPYRARGKWVEHKKGRRWKKFKRRPSHAMAKAQATAINMSLLRRKKRR